MSRTVRSIRLNPELWRALDSAALATSHQGGRYVSANALLEEIVRTRIASGPLAVSTNPALERTRQARTEQRSREAARVAAQKRYVEHLLHGNRSEQKYALAEAAAKVARWRRNRLASPLYAEAWERLLRAGFKAIVRAFESGYEGLSPVALAVNSPFFTRAPASETR